MIEVAYTQHSGKQHRTQQDAIWNGVACVQGSNVATNSHVVPENRLLLAVADGVAISPFPHLASRFVIEAIAELGVNADLSIKLVRDIQGRLCDRYAKDRTLGASTTLVAAKCFDDVCHVINVGDSRAYLILASGEWKQLSHDHTILNELIEAGQADSKTAYAQMYDGLAHCLIADDEEDGFAAHHIKTTFSVGDGLLLCSDGLHDTLGDDRIQLLYNPNICSQKQVEIWRRAVLAAEAPDNFSIILARRMPDSTR